MRQQILQWDHRLTEQLVGRPAAWRPLMRLMTLLGAPELVLPALLALGLLEFGWGSQRVGVALLLAVVASFANLGVSFVLRRHRPNTPYANQMPVKTYSLPSAHAFGAVVLGGLLGYLTLHVVAGWLWAFLIAGLLLYALLIGLSRVYLGAHYALDVLAGWAVGSIALAIIIGILAYAPYLH